MREHPALAAYPRVAHEPGERDGQPGLRVHLVQKRPGILLDGPLPRGGHFQAELPHEPGESALEIARNLPRVVPGGAVRHLVALEHGHLLVGVFQRKEGRRNACNARAHHGHVGLDIPAQSP